MSDFRRYHKSVQLLVAIVFMLVELYEILSEIFGGRADRFPSVGKAVPCSETKQPTTNHDGDPKGMKMTRARCISFM